MHAWSIATADDVAGGRLELDDADDADDPGDTDAAGDTDGVELEQPAITMTTAATTSDAMSQVAANARTGRAYPRR